MILPVAPELGFCPKICVFNAFAGFSSEAGLLREILPGGTKTNTGPLASGFLVETCTACLYSCQNIDKTATNLRCRNRLIVVLATGLH